MRTVTNETERYVDCECGTTIFFEPSKDFGYALLTNKRHAKGLSCPNCHTFYEASTCSIWSKEVKLEDISKEYLLCLLPIITLFAMTWVVIHMSI